MSTLITSDSTAEEIAEALGHMLAAARHEQRIVRKYTTDEPTPHEVRHAALDDLVSCYLRAKAKQPA